MLQAGASHIRRRVAGIGRQPRLAEVLVQLGDKPEQLVGEAPAASCLHLDPSVNHHDHLDPMLARVLPGCLLARE
jgi:hypothetical protein